MRCLVLAQRMAAIGLGACSAMSGTDVLYGPTRMGMHAEHGGRSPPMEIRICYAVSGTDCPLLNYCMLLRACYAVSGSDLAYAAIRRIGSTTPQAYTAAVPQHRVLCPICLRGYYAMPGTDLASRSTSVLPAYAMAGTDLAYGAPRGNRLAAAGLHEIADTLSDTRSMLPEVLRICYALSGIKLGHAATRPAYDA
eukprot:1642601-Rhodomonas_salina.5